MDLAILARIHQALDELAAHPRSAKALATAWWQLMVLAPAYPAVYLQQGAWLLAAGDVDGAANVFAVAAEATGDPTFDLRRVDCLRRHGEAPARAALTALVASQRGADDVRGHWQLAVLELDRDGAPRRAAARLTEFLLGSPVRDAADLRRKLPALLLLLECARAGGEAERMEGQFVGVDAAVLAACAAEDPAERGARLREALRGDPYHPWGRYALAGVLAAAGEPELARANLEVAVQGEPALAWRARHDPTFAGLSLTDLDPAAELPCEPWIRVEDDHLPVRTGSEEAAQRAWWTLPRAVRAVVQVTDAGLRVRAPGKMTAGYVQLYRGLRALAPFVRAGRLLVQEEGAGWIDELRFVGGELQIRRDELPGDDAAARHSYLSARASSDPKDRWIARLVSWGTEDPLTAMQAECERPGAPIEVFHRYGLALQNARRWDEAIAAYDRAIAGRPDASSGAKLNKGNVFAALRRWSEALACYDAAIAETPRMAYAWGGRGQALRNLGRASEADAALHEAIKLDDKFSNPWLELAQLYFADSPRAVALCDEALRRNPKCQYTWSTKGSALNNLGRWAEAHACYDRAIALDDDYWHPHYCRACSYALQGDRERALAAVKATLARDPNKAKMLRGDADLLALHRDPRFVALTREA